MEKKQWISPSLTIYNRETIDILTAKGVAGVETTPGQAAS